MKLLHNSTQYVCNNGPGATSFSGAIRFFPFCFITKLNANEKATMTMIVVVDERRREGEKRLFLSFRRFFLLVSRGDRDPTHGSWNGISRPDKKKKKEKKNGRSRWESYSFSLMCAVGGRPVVTFFA